MTDEITAYDAVEGYCGALSYAPGERLTVRMWETDDGVALFQTTGDDGRVVLDGGKLRYS